MPKVAIVGAGIAGAATAWALARRGVEVTVYEQFGPGHRRGSSHGLSRIWRLAYPQPEWVELARIGLEGWRQLEHDAGETLLVSTGLLELTAEEDIGSLATLQAAGIAAEALSQAEVEQRFGLTFPAGWSCLFQPEAGYVLADRALAAFLTEAARHGARIEYEHRVADLDDVDADTVVVTAGPWAPKLLSSQGIELPAEVTRETVAFFRLAHPVPSILEIASADRAFDMYALVDPEHGLKVGCHKAGPAADPDDEDATPSPELVAGMAEWVRERVPDADPEPVDAQTCFYTSTDDDRFLLERHGRLVVGSACSGHAFKFAPAVGALLADLAIGSP